MTTYSASQLRRMSIEELSSLIESDLGGKVPEGFDKASLVDYALRLQGPDESPRTRTTRSDHVRIIIHKSPDIDGKEPVKISINGEPRFTLLIKRGEAVSVPREILGVLDDAVITEYRSEVDPMTRVTTHREEKVPRFAYTILGDG